MEGHQCSDPGIQLSLGPHHRGYENAQGGHCKVTSASTRETNSSRYGSDQSDKIRHGDLQYGWEH